MNWDWVSKVLGILNQLGGLAGTGYGLYKAMNPPEMPKPEPIQYSQPPQPAPMGGFGGGGGGGGFSFAEPEPDPKALVKAYLNRRAGLQSRGLYSGGASSPEAIAGFMDLEDPEVLYRALRDQGVKY